MLEARYPCPVCLGLPMNKVAFPFELHLDQCNRCGGIWFDAHEVQHLAKISPALALQKLDLKPRPFITKCHQCAEPLKRDLKQCEYCHWEQRIDCPHCLETMAIQKLGDLTLDFCKRCKGVWFDQHELHSIWNRQLSHWLQDRRHHHRSLDRDDWVEGFFDVLYFSPDLAYWGGHLLAESIVHAPEIATGTVESLTHAPEIAGGLIEGAAELAGGIFGTIAEIIGGLFDGF